MAKRYGVLPSEVLRKGSSLDLYCGQLAVDYDHYCKERAEAEHKNGAVPLRTNYSTEDLQSMLNTVRSKRD